MMEIVSCTAARSVIPRTAAKYPVTETVPSIAIRPITTISSTSVNAAFPAGLSVACAFILIISLLFDSYTV